MTPKIAPLEEWRISKEGYRTIIGKGTVSAMDETNLDLEETPMRREDWPVSILFVVLPILLLILLIVGVSILFFLGRRKADPIIEDQPPDIVSSIDNAESDG